MMQAHLEISTRKRFSGVSPAPREMRVIGDVEHYRCTFKDHEGERWLPIAEFSRLSNPHSRCHVKSWCKACCRASMAAARAARRASRATGGVA